MRSVLISGFEAFHTHSYNVTELLVRRLESQPQSDFVIRTVVLPVVRWESVQILSSAITTHKPDAIIALGQSRRSGISLERVALNCDHFKIPDNAGNQPLNASIVDDGPDSYRSSLPLKALFVTLSNAHIPVHYSDTAGSYVCNHLFYGLMHTLSHTSLNAGFVHMPMLPEQINHPDHPSLTFDTQLQALKLMLDTLNLHLNRSG